MTRNRDARPGRPITNLRPVRDGETAEPSQTAQVTVTGGETVHVRPSAVAVRAGAAAPPPPQVSPAAERARRYRQRRKAEATGAAPVPGSERRRPGPKPSTAASLRREVEQLRQRVAELDRAAAEAQTPGAVIRRQRSATIASAARDLAEALARTDGGTDGPELRVLLGDVAVAIDARRDRWPAH